MAYIGYQPSQLATAPFAVNTFTGDGSTTTFTLSQAVPGANEAMVEVVVENVQQNPIDAYTIGGGTNTSLIFSEAPASGAAIYVIHKGEGTYNLQPSTGSVTSTSLDPVLRNFTVDTFTGNASATTFTLTDTPYSANSIIVTVDGILQTATTNYTVSGTTLSFGTDAPASGAAITVLHLGFSSGNKSVADGTITPTKLSSGGPYWTSTGSVGIGSSSLTGYSLRVSKNITGGAGSYGIINDGTIQSDVTVVAYGMRSNLSTAASAFTLANIRHYDATQSTIGAGSTVTNQAGFFVDNSLIGATNNYGFFGNIPSGSNRWNLYMNGTAANYLNGDLGIGTNNTAGYALAIERTSNNALMKLTAITTGGAGIDLINSGGAEVSYIGTGASGQALTFRAGSSTERMRIDASGNVGIATTSPSTYGKFAVVGVGYFSSNLGVGSIPSAWESGSINYQQSIAGAGGTAGNTFAMWGRADSIRLWTNAYFNGGTYVRQVAASVVPTNITMDSTGSIVMQSAPSSTAGSTFVTGDITTLFSIKKDNTLALQGATQSAGVGIAFPATQVASANANTLDDYEEGTWTPTYVSASGTFTTLTYAFQTGVYVKIGRVVYCHVDIGTATVALGTASSTLRIAGLPFAPTANTRLYAAQNNNWSTNSPNCGVTTTSSFIEVGYNNAVNNSFCSPSDLSTVAGTKNEFHSDFVYYTAT